MSYGKGDFLPLEAVRSQFERCERDPSMRSVSAIVRIAREQLLARGSLSSYPRVTALFLGIAGAAFVARLFLPESMAQQATYASLGALALACILGTGVLATRKDTRRLTAEEREIKKSALEHLERLLSQPIDRRKPPDWTEANFLRQIGGRKAGPAVRAWLAEAEDTR